MIADRVPGRTLTRPAGLASLGDLLDDALCQHKSLVALIEADRKREVARYTFEQVEAWVRTVTHRLAAAGIGPDDRVALLMGNGPRWLVVAIAAFRRGAVLVPLDPKLSADEHRALLAHCRPQLLVVDHSLFDKLEVPDAVKVWVTLVPPGAALGAAQSFDEGPGFVGAPLQAVARTRDDLATIVYSSGTGGRPKGCLLTHGAYLAQLDGLLDRFPMAPGDRFFSVLPTNHAIDFMVGFVGPFCCGATVVHQRTLRPEMLRFTLKRYGITHMAVVPLLLTAFERAIREQLDDRPNWQQEAFGALRDLNGWLTDRQPNHWLSRKLLSPVHAALGGKLRLMFCGGAYTDRAQADFFIRLGIPVVIGYGLTEACTVVTVNGVQPPRADSVGRPLQGIEVRIDGPDEHGVGQVCVRGPTLMRGYLDDPELTAETLRDGWLHTGDLGYFDASHHLHLCGRRKDVIVTAGGKNVYPEDVAFAFADLADAEEVAVFATNRVWPAKTMVGETLLLVVRPAAAVGPAMGEISERNRALPAHKRVSFVLGVDEPFPHTASMKLKRDVLADQVGMTHAATSVVAIGQRGVS